MSIELTAQERESLRDWWDSESDGATAGTMLAHLDATVERIIAARLAGAVVEWSSHANEGLSAAVLAAKAEAWDEGFDAGSISATQKLHANPNRTPNPYREATP